MNWNDAYAIALAVTIPAVSLMAAGHALLTKRDPRAALGWVAVCMMFPVAGPVGYLLFGINRVRTRARELGRRYPFSREVTDTRDPADSAASGASLLPESQRRIARVSEAVTKRPLLGGNHIEALFNAELAYPAMLEAIAGARNQVLLASYIFNVDRSGKEFVEALAAAVERGVDVRVIVDGVGEFYSPPGVSRLLRRRGVRVARFLPPRLLPPSLHVNLRNHRKILVVDGDVGFTGGMNISDHHWVEPSRRRNPVADMHFRLRGPVVSQLAEVFLEDWGFCKGSYDAPPEPSTHNAGSAVCRTIKDGPNEDLARLATILLGAIGAAQQRLAIVTPYFLPSAEMVSALGTAALRGVEVSVLIPQRSNMPFVDWATRNMLAEPLDHGVQVLLQPPPFAHTKLFLVDDYYVQVGSANIDQRSLRLNFELAVESFDTAFAATLWREVDHLRQHATALLSEDIESRSLPQRVRDAVAWLATPYL